MEAKIEIDESTRVKCPKVHFVEKCAQIYVSQCDSAHLGANDGGPTRRTSQIPPPTYSSPRAR
jgi:hypothetical protein